MASEHFRKQFPQLGEKVYGKTLVYLDNAATSQRPLQVLDKWEEMSSRFNANIHRAVHRLADSATQEYESARDAVAGFLNAARDEIVFTSGTTMSVNMAAFIFGERFVSEGDEIIVTEAEHHSNIVPWHMMCQRRKAVLKVLPVDESGHLDVAALDDLISDRTRIVCVAQISNVLGLRNPVREISDICHRRGCRIFVDGAQGAVHEKTDVRELDCDFYAFSGHKIYAPTGTGVLYCKKELLEQLPPYMGGGEMIESVKWSEITYTRIPHRFEAGTQNFNGVPALKPALEIAREMREDSSTTEEQRRITEYVYSSLMRVPEIRLFGVPRHLEEKVPLFSFCVRGAHHEDIALIMDKMGVALRSGQMCAEPLMDRFGVTGMLRASFAPYNTLAEAEYFVESLHKAIKMIKG